MYQLDNFILTSVEKDHLPHITRWANDSLLSSINTKKHKLGIKTIDLLISNLPNTTQLLIILMNKEVVGFCEFTNINHRNKTCFMNVYMDSMDQNFILHGYKVLGMLSDYAFLITGINKISCDLLFENTMLISVFKQRGFKVEVHKRAHTLIGGNYKTIVEMALLRSEVK